jgi:lipoyl(octanoyl) transferase
MARAGTFPLEVYLLGIVDYPQVQSLQRRLAYEVEETESAALILCEHPRTITIGRSGSRTQILPDDEDLRHAGVAIHWAARGGGCVLHTPGQIVAYLNLPLKLVSLSVKQYIQILEKVLVRTLAEFDLRGQTRPDCPGIFLGNARVATLGVGVHRWVTSFGLTLNVGPYLAPYAWVIDHTSQGQIISVTSMEARRQRPAPMHKVRAALIRQFETLLGLECVHLYTDHPNFHHHRSRMNGHVACRR